jgi:hypothetical protein
VSKVCREAPTVDIDSEEDLLEQQILQMDLFYSVKPVIESSSITKQTELLTEITRGIAAKKMQKA